MDHDDLLALFDLRMREEARPDAPDAVVERIGAVVRQTGAASDWNGVLWSSLDRATADAAIAEQVRHFTALGHDVEWTLYGHDEPDDLGERLRTAGFVPEPAETVMVAGVDDLCHGSEMPEGVTLVDITTARDVTLLTEVHRAAFGTDPGALHARLLRQLDLDTVLMTVAVVDGQPVSAARLEVSPGTGFAGLWGGGTLPDWRGRGIYRALVAHRAAAAARRGARFLRVDASEQSRPILLRLGFTALTSTTPYVRRTAAQWHPTPWDTPA
ncbi:GNAT family N-acetyltransferase [Streptomyces sp. NPDC005953]|uniref:GNAT family N-acetyltransferase n=1 Tax=Streptomyces sp. NPDC005953 TaxID=3156719 RepID=UPI0033E495AE